MLTVGPKGQRGFADAVEDLDSVPASPQLFSVILAQSDLAISEQALGTECSVLLPSDPGAVDHSATFFMSLYIRRRWRSATGSCSSLSSA